MCGGGDISLKRRSFRCPSPSPLAVSYALMRRRAKENYFHENQHKNTNPNEVSPYWSARWGAWKNKMAHLTIVSAYPPYTGCNIPGREGFFRSMVSRRFSTTLHPYMVSSKVHPPLTYLTPLLFGTSLPYYLTILLVLPPYLVCSPAGYTWCDRLLTAKEQSQSETINGNRAQSVPASPFPFPLGYPLHFLR